MQVPESVLFAAEQLPSTDHPQPTDVLASHAPCDVYDEHELDGVPPQVAEFVVSHRYIEEVADDTVALAVTRVAFMPKDP